MKFWRTSEERVLKELIGTMSLAGIAEKLGRTECAIKSHATIMGLLPKKKRPRRVIRFNYRFNEYRRTELGQMFNY